MRPVPPSGAARSPWGAAWFNGANTPFGEIIKGARGGRQQIPVNSKAKVNRFRL